MHPDKGNSTPIHDVRMRGFRSRSDVDDLIELIDRRVLPLESETVSIHGAAGRRLSQSVVAPTAVPGFVRGGDGTATRFVAGILSAPVLTTS